ncbi:MAG TPA: AAA family ATPase [Acidimicrobiia bacterium]|nr:AAA family ATPase [Acidimicrobiia bacterium]
MTGEPLAVPAVPLPALLRGMGRVFVGRERELGELEQRWKEASAGELRLALVAGEPGVGKTRLAGEMAARLHARGATVLAGSCGEDLGVPYQPFVEALRHQVDHTPADGLAGRLGRYPGELVRLMPELADIVPALPPPLRSDPETERYRLFDAVGSWLAHASGAEPVLLVVDDLQWAAKPTLLLLRHVARFTEPMRVLVLGTYRDTEITRRHPLTEAIADFRRLAGFVRLARRAGPDGSRGLHGGSGRPAPRGRRGSGAGRRDPRRDRGEPLLRQGGAPSPDRSGCRSSSGRALGDRPPHRRTRDP